MIAIPHFLSETTAPLFTRWKVERFVYVILSVLIIATWLPRLRGPIDLRWDGAVYYVLGTSIAEGKGYRLLNEPGEIQAIQYPPVLPFVVAVHQWVLGSNDPLIVGPWLRMTAFVIFFAYILTIYAVLRLYLPLKVAFIGTVLCLFHIQTYFMSDLLFPEVLYGLTTTAFVLVHHRSCTRASVVVEAVLAIVAFGLRTIGVALLAAWITESVLNRKYREASVRFAIAVVPVLCWQGYIASVVTGSEYSRPAYAYQRATYMFYNVSYANNIFTLKDAFVPELGPASLGDLTKRVLLNFAQIPQAIGVAVSAKRESYETLWKLYELPFPFSTPWPVDVTLAILGGLVIGGMVLQFARRQWLLPTYIVFSIASICVTPWSEQFSRYLMPLAPFLVLFMMSAFLATTSELGRWRMVGEALARVAVCLILLQQVVGLGMAYIRWHQNVTYRDQQGHSLHYRLFFYQDAHRAFDAGVDWLQGHAKPSEVIAGSMPHWMYLRTGLKAVMSPFEPDPVKAQALLDSVPVTYLLLDEGLAVETKRYMAPVVQQFPERWERVYADSIAPDPDRTPGGEFTIYRRVGLKPSRRDLATLQQVQ